MYGSIEISVFLPDEGVKILTEEIIYPPSNEDFESPYLLFPFTGSFANPRDVELYKF